jgi:type IV secretory pathway VirJ component
MKWMWSFVSWFVLGLALAPVSALAQGQGLQPAQKTAPQTLSHGLFSDVQVVRPKGTPKQFVMLLSEGDGTRPDEQKLIEKMASAGAMVAVVPLAPFYRRLEAQDGKCTYAGGALENLARHVQAFERLPTYLLPMLVGSGASASFAYAVLAQAPNGTFASAMSVGFCPRFMFKTPMCAANALRWQAGAAGGNVDLQPADSLSAPWTALLSGAETACTPATAQAFVQRVPQASWLSAKPADSPAATAADVLTAFDAAYATLATRQTALDPPPAKLADLPVVEVPAAGNGTRFAVLLSGDGGWAGIDKGIAAALAAKGVPVAGFDSLRYFWSARTPEGLASDLDRLIRYYAARWNRSEVILIGYSQGADVLPFAINRLPHRTRARVRLTALLGLGQKASFEFHVSNWIGPSGDKPIAPEARKLLAADTVCIYGQAEKDSLCPQLAPAHVRPLPLAGGHHFGGDYDQLAMRILDAAPK